MKSMRKLQLFLVAMLMTIGVALAQTRLVKGRVVSSDTKEAIIQANVIVKDQPTIGTVTDLDGNFQLKVPTSTKVLAVSYVGYETKLFNLVPAGAPRANEELLVVLSPDSKLVDEVVVVAYGRTTKNAFTGSASTVNMSDILNKATTNVTKALEGAVPGVQVFNTSGQPGSGATVQIRGIGSVNSSTAPLYVVDGVPFGLNMNGIDAADIESMSVLKDASATALYGSRAANGVVLITTRRGKSGKTRIEANINVGINARLTPLYETIDDPREFVEMSYAALKNKWNYFNFGARVPANMGPEHFIFRDGSISIPARYNPFINPETGQTAATAELIDPTTGKFVSGFTLRPGFNTKAWEDALFRSGKRYEGNVKVSGGTQGTTYYASIGLQKNEGYLVGSEFTRINLRNNIASQVTENLRATLGLAYTNSTTNAPGQGGASNNAFNFLNGIPKIYPVLDQNLDGSFNNDPKLPGGLRYDYGDDINGVKAQFARPYSPGINPAGAIGLDKDRTVRHQTTANLNLEYRFLDDFKLSVSYGLQALGSRNDEVINPYYGDSKGMGRLYKTATTYTSHTLTEMLSWGHKYGKHNVDAFVAHESYEESTESSFTNASGSVVAGSTNASTYLTSEPSRSNILEYAIESYFGQARYDYDGKYFVSASVRRDGSSRFAKGNRWGTFGSVGLAWLISKENFLKDVKWINSLKLKASYGVLGNQDISLGYGSNTPNYYVSYDLYELSKVNGLPAFNFYAKGNPDISWENSATFNTGFESRLFNNRLTFDAEFFYKHTTAMLYRKQVAPSVGYAYLPGNDGAMSNYGIEAELTYKAIQGKNVSLDLRANAGFYRNKITQMAHDNTTGKPKHYEVQGSYAYKKGHSVQDFYLRQWAGVDSKTGYPQWVQYYTENEAGVKTPITDYEDWIASEGNKPEDLKQTLTNDYNQATRLFNGKSSIPDLVGGFGFDLKVHGITLSSSFSFGLGGYALDGLYADMMDASQSIGSYALHKDMRQMWRKEGDQTDVPMFAAGEPALNYANATGSTRFLTSRSFLNLSNLRLSYDLPKSLLGKLKIDRAQVYVSGDNLFILSARKGFISMSSATGGTSTHRYMPGSTITAGLQIAL